MRTWPRVCRGSHSTRRLLPGMGRGRVRHPRAVGRVWGGAGVRLTCAQDVDSAVLGAGARLLSVGGQHGLGAERAQSPPWHPHPAPIPCTAPQTHLGVLDHAVSVLGPTLQLHQVPRARPCRCHGSLRGAGASSGHPLPPSGSRIMPQPPAKAPHTAGTPLPPASPCAGAGAVAATRAGNPRHCCHHQRPAQPCSPSPWHPASAASPGWPRCSRAGAGCRGWHRQARGSWC